MKIRIKDKYGEVITGELIEENEKYYIIKTSQGNVLIKRGYVISVMKEEDHNEEQ